MPPKRLVEGVRSALHPLHGTWSNMRGRCNNPKNKDYQFYGALGIEVCSRWDDFALFVQDLKPLGPRPRDFTLDRIDSAKDYAPDNVRWASKSKQARNQKMRRTNKSGHPGVNQMKCGGYVARIHYGNDRVYLGYFLNINDAIVARKKAEQDLRWKDVE